MTIKGIDGTFMVPRTVATETERAAARRWLRERLAGGGFRDDELIVRTELVSVDADTGDVMAREVGKEQVIDLG